jgi:hypothetical protein
MGMVKIARQRHDAASAQWRKALCAGRQGEHAGLRPDQARHPHAHVTTPDDQHTRATKALGQRAERTLV